MVIHITPGPSCEVAVASDDRLTRFCFKCRKYLPHSWALMDDPPERQPSYYDAVPVLRCARCRRDYADFPGTYRDGPRYPSEAIWRDLVEQAKRKRDSWDWDAIWARFHGESRETERRTD